MMYHIGQIVDFVFSTINQNLEGQSTATTHNPQILLTLLQTDNE